MKLLLAAFAFVVALWLFGRRPEPVATTTYDGSQRLVINWRDLEQVDSV